jgi:hypothetical protein
LNDDCFAAFSAVSFIFSRITSCNPSKKIASVKGHPDFTEAVELFNRTSESSDSGSSLENLFSRYESFHGLNHNHTYSGYLPSHEDQARN